MFIGQLHSPLDRKNRLTLPPRYKGKFSGSVYVTQGFDRNLMLLPGGVFREILDSLRGMNIADPVARLLFRMILGSATQLTPDTKDGLAIPKELIEFAGIEREVVLVGQGDYLEVWSPGGWQEQEISLSNVEANSHRFASLTICTG